MNHILWTLLAIFIPNAIGIILYFILRDPMPVPCPSCGTPARKGHAYCAGCGAAVRAACPQCRQPVETGWRNCARCGAALTPASPPPPPAL
jgi:predicted amidophosphoribosyltransferase